MNESKIRIIIQEELNKILTRRKPEFSNINISLTQEELLQLQEDIEFIYYMREFKPNPITDKIRNLTIK